MSHYAFVIGLFLYLASFRVDLLNGKELAYAAQPKEALEGLTTVVAAGTENDRYRDDAALFADDGPLTFNESRALDMVEIPERHSSDAKRPIDPKGGAKEIQLALEIAIEGEVNLFARRDFSPLVDIDQPDGGALTAIMTTALERAGYEPVVRFSNWNDEIDAVRWVTFPYPRDAEKEAGFLFSAPIVSLEVLAYTRQGSDFIIDGPVDLAGRRICASQALIEQALHAVDEAGQAAFDAIDGELAACFRALGDGVADIVLADARWNALISRELSTERLASSRPIELGSLHAVMPKLSSYSRAMMYGLNNALAAMRRSGEIDTIIEENEVLPNLQGGGDVDVAPTPAPQAAPTPAPAKDPPRVPKGATM